MPSPIRIGIVGASGYTGLELCRLLARHPEARITHLFSRQLAGKSVRVCFPHLEGLHALEYSVFEAEQLPDVEVLFLALPHGESHTLLPKLMGKGIKIIDLSADFRLSDPQEFKRYYGLDHGAPDLIKSVSYGIPELYRETIRQREVCANPGCYPTSVILGLYPFAKAGLLESPVIIDAKSGVSGAGKGLKESSLFCEVEENFSPYSTFNHRHVPEMQEHLGISVLFSPHLVPMNRGMLSTMYLPLRGLSAKAIEALYADCYANEPFVTYLGETPVHTKQVAGSNYCHIGIKRCEEIDGLVVFSVIDNLGKGASGQAIQNMNIMCGFDETAGINQLPSYL
jgi:N-acetyl-gamma-glutamyl-phosphate reductase